MSIYGHNSPHLLAATFHCLPFCCLQDRAEVISRAREAGVAAIIVTGCTVASATAARDLCESVADFPLFFTAGVHPHNAKDCDESTLAQLTELAKHERCVAIGEWGTSGVVVALPAVVLWCLHGICRWTSMQVHSQPLPLSAFAYPVHLLPACLMAAACACRRSRLDFNRSSSQFTVAPCIVAPSVVFPVPPGCCVCLQASVV
jgi:hypothetical protein